MKKELAQTNQLAAEVTKLKAEIAELKEKLGQSSRNSSLPPSTDSPFRKRANWRESSGRKPGAQPGHKGTGRVLKPIAEVDLVIDLRPTARSNCNALLLGDSYSPARRQVSEITSAGTLLTEYRRYSPCRLACGRLNHADWSDEARAGSFGARVKAVIGFLTGRLGVSRRDAVETTHELFSIKIGLGSISAIQRRISRDLNEPVRQVQEFISLQPATNIDETTWRAKENSPWLRVSATEKATAFRILPGRSQKDAQTIINESSKQIVTIDRYPGYNWIAAHNRQVCWAHLKRDFKDISEREGDSQRIGAEWLEQSKELFQLWQRVRDAATAK